MLDGYLAACLVTAGIVTAGIWSLAPGAAWAKPEVVVRAEWGSGLGQLGRRGGDESAPEGPMSFAVTPGGEVWVLDQVNRRVVHFADDGRYLADVPIGLDTFQGLALAPSGELVLMDRLAARVVRVLSPDGAMLAEVPLEGVGIDEGGGATALFARDDGVWVEYDHSQSVRVLDAQWRAPAVRELLPGRPLGPGAMSGQARRAGPAAVELRTVDRETDLALAETTLVLAEPVWRIAELAGDAQGNVALAVHLLREDPAREFAVAYEALAVLVLDGALVERRRVVTTPSVGGWEQWKEFEIAADGTIWQMAFVAGGVEVRRWRP
jgi:hypothetical protein